MKGWKDRLTKFIKPNVKAIAMDCPRDSCKYQFMLEYNLAKQNKILCQLLISVTSFTY